MFRTVFNLLFIAASCRICSAANQIHDFTFPTKVTTTEVDEIVTEYINATRGDIIRWTFDDEAKAGNHSVIQVSLYDPCTPLENGFASPVGSLNTGQFAIMIVDDTTPIYWTCASASPDHVHDHCQEGEIGIIYGSALADNERNSLHLRTVAAPHTGALGHKPATGLGSGVGAVVVDIDAPGSTIGSASVTSTTAVSSTSSQTSTPADQAPTSPSSPLPASTPYRRAVPLAAVIVPSCVGAALVVSLLALFAKKRRHAARASAPTAGIDSSLRPYNNPSQHTASAGASRDTSRFSPEGKAVAFKRMVEGRTATDSGIADSLDRPEDVQSTSGGSDASNWQAVQRAALSAGLSRDALLASLTRVQHSWEPDDGAAAGSLPPRYDEL